MDLCLCLRLIILGLVMVNVAGQDYLLNNLSIDQSKDQEPKKCTKASQCGNAGCCLNGWCSTTGATFNKCYSKVRQNGRPRPPRIWRKTDLCPCEYASYCSLRKPYKKHPIYGAIGSCFPIMG